MYVCATTARTQRVCYCGYDTVLYINSHTPVYIRTVGYVWQSTGMHKSKTHALWHAHIILTHTCPCTQMCIWHKHTTHAHRKVSTINVYTSHTHTHTHTHTCASCTFVKTHANTFTHWQTYCTCHNCHVRTWTPTHTYVHKDTITHYLLQLHN